MVGMDSNQNRYLGVIGSISFHLFLFLLFWIIGFGRNIPKDEEGMEVMFGNTEVAAGNPVPKPVMLTNQEEQIKTTTTTAAPKSNSQLLTQDNEESLALQEQKRKKQAEAEAKLKADQENARLAQEARQKQEQQRKINDISNKTSGAFGKNGQSGSGYATSGKGFQGSPNGNSTSGAVTGSGGNGNTPSFSLAGRRPIGSLPSPNYSDQVEGRIVVDIVVTPDGKVISADIDIARTTISVRSMREAARKAALQSRFSDLDAHDNQVGSITYNYKLTR